jgi:uncharacterized membrane protein YcaP (DUF421 family)
MVMMAVVPRGEIHSKENIQEQAIRVKRSDRELAPACFRGIQGHGTLRGASAGPLNPGVPARYSSTRRSFRRNLMHSKVWTDMFVLALPVAEKILRPIVVYFFLVIGLRLAGKRELAQLNPFDLVVLLTLSNTVQNAIIGDDNSVTGGIIGAATLLLVNYLVVRLLFRHEKLDRIVEGEATVLIEHGRILDDKLANEVLSLEELEAAAHKQGFGDLGEVDRATLDPSGTISFTARKPAPEEARHREVLERLDRMAGEIATLRLRAAPPAS